MMGAMPGRPTRREFALTASAIAVACGGSRGATGWPRAWDRILIEKAAQTEAQRFDEKESLVTRLLGPEYRYHTHLRLMRAHDLRASADYALALLELGSVAGLTRAVAILDRLCALQDVDPASKWYGLWGYYLEEPLPRMDQADWNWADFLGGTILLIDIRHSRRLTGGLVTRLREAIRHAALSIQRRDVSADYTNIAVKGTFVCACAGERLGLTDLSVYAAARMARIEAFVNESGSFAEYNSPPYAAVTLTDLTRMRMFLAPGAVRDTGARLERRLWLHLARHWDGYRLQFAGPMSRCYETDLGEPFWLEKALGGRLGLADPAQRPGYGDLDAGIHDYRCPSDLASSFLRPRSYFQREQFRVAASPLRPVQGATYITPAFSLGTVNRGDFWMQSRPLLAYFGGPERPARIVRLRVVKDGYDFASALLWTVQQDGYVLGLVNFRSPGGDRHPSLDPIRDGGFSCGRLFLELSFEGLAPGFSFRKDGATATVVSAPLHAGFTLLDGRFGDRALTLEGSATTRAVTLTVDFKALGSPNRLGWADVRHAYAFFQLSLFSEPLTTPPARVPLPGPAEDLCTARWETPAGALELSGSTRVAPIDHHEAAFSERINGQDVPIVRLEESKP